MPLFEKTNINQDEFADRVRTLLTDHAEFLIKKNTDYGNASMELGLPGNFVHIWDKVSRLRSLIEKEAKGELPNFESIRDTLMDLIGYAAIGVLIHDEAASRSSNSALPTAELQPPIATQKLRFATQSCLSLLSSNEGMEAAKHFKKDLTDALKAGDFNSRFVREFAEEMGLSEA